MDVQQELQTRNVYLFDEFEDDDVFYCELRRQVLQLTAEEDDVVEDRNMNMGKQGPNYGPSAVSREYYDWSGYKEDYAAPVWMLNLWRTGNGTGVFIPQIVQSKKKNRSGRRKNERRRRTYMRVEKM